MRRSWLRGALVLAALSAGLLVFASREHEAPAQPVVDPTPVPLAVQELNKGQAKRVFDDLFTKGRYDQIEQIYDKGCKIHFGGGRHQSLEQTVAEGKNWRNAAPDLVMTADTVNADNDLVAVTWTAKGTHSGDIPAMKATGKPVALHGTSTFKFANGKIVEAWNSEYRDDLFRQVGVPKTMALLYETVDDLRWRVNEVLR
jgi:predicted ester cyclase